MRKTLAMGVFITLVFQTSSFAQQGFELLEIVKIGEMYRNVPNLSFNLDYYYSDSANTSNVLEHLTGFSKISNGRYYTVLDSAEYLQGYQYNLAVFNRDSAIVINDKQDYPDLLKVPVLDSVFADEYVDSLILYTTDDLPTNTLLVYLSVDSPYSDYRLTYDKTSYRILSIEFYIKGIPAEDGGVSSGTAKLSIQFSSYSNDPVQQDVFWEDKFIYKQGGQIYLKPEYSGYQLLDNTHITQTQSNSNAS